MKDERGTRPACRQGRDERRRKQKKKRGLLFFVLRSFLCFSLFIFFLLSSFFLRIVFAQAPAASGAEEYEKLKKEHEALQANYNNVLAQAQALLPYKNKARDMEDTVRQFEAVKQEILKEKEAAVQELAALRDTLKSSDQNIVKITQERDEYKKSFEKASVENIIGAGTKKKIEDLQKENAALNGRVLELEEKMKVMEQEILRSEATTELFKRQSAELKDKYDEARKQNRTLEKKLEELPKNFAELARENKILIKRSAVMHYNLGVFYTQNKEFERALAEFEKAVELNPDDSASYFNLGYIYAEHLQNRAKAVSCFKQFLKLAKSDDKDAEWVKRYILTWQTWEGHVPIK